MRNSLQSGVVKVGDYHFFTIYDPKQRQICAASFSERVLHHALMNVCHNTFEKQQIFDSYATRKNKGTYAALSRAEYFQKKYKWFLKLDIRKFFDSVDHSVLYKLLHQKFKDKAILQIFKQIINSYCTTQNKGIPIGNLTSQYFANYYLSFIDRYIQQEITISGYVRYMDDLVLWSNDKEELKKSKLKIIEFLDSALALKLKICEMNNTAQGLSFLGYRLLKDKAKLTKRSKKRFIEKSQYYLNKLNTNEWSQEDYQKHILPLLANAKHADTMMLRNKLFINTG